VAANKRIMTYPPRPFHLTTYRPYVHHHMCIAIPLPCFGFAPAAPDTLLVSKGRVLLSDQPLCQVTLLITP